jgi:DNA-directed RNA polymerase subunit omega
MARVTVEDCIEIVPNRFELVALASQRTKDIGAGAQITVDRDNDKNPVIALREIANNSIDVAILRNNLAQGVQYRAKVDTQEEDQPETEESMDSMDILSEINSYNSTTPNDDEMSGMSFEDEVTDTDD